MSNEAFNSVNKPSIDVPKLMAEIRERVKSEAQNFHKKDFKPHVVSESTRRAGELVNSEELRFLNMNYAFGPNLNLDAVSSHRPGIIGKVIVKLKRKLLGVIWSLLKDYFTSEREFQSNLVRYLNDISRYVDARDANNFIAVNDRFN